MNASLYFCIFSISCCWSSVVIGPSSLVMHFPAISNVQHAITDLPSKPIFWTIFLLQKLKWRATINHKLVQNKHKSIHFSCNNVSSTINDIALSIHTQTHFKNFWQIGSFCRITQEDIVIFTIATRGSGVFPVILSCLHKTYCHLPLSEPKLLDMKTCPLLPLSATINTWLH